jgi:hypothetical protein
MQYQGEDIDIPDSLVETLGAAIEEGVREVEIRLKRFR